MIILALASVGWSVFLTLVIGPRVFPQNWFEHSLAEFGESQGNVATGFVMVDMVDPSRQTDVVRGYSYRQLLTRPVVGGGFITALAVPLIRCLGTSGLYDRDRGDHRRADGLGHAPGGSRTGRFPEPRTAGSQSLM